jgi:hypothetical protein
MAGRVYDRRYTVGPPMTLLPTIRAMTNRTTNTRARNLAMSADVLARPPKPSAAAMIAMIAKAMAHQSMVESPL